MTAPRPGGRVARWSRWSSLGVRVELPANAPIVLLREIGRRPAVLPIFIGPPRQPAIAYALQGVETPRPMTHDLLRTPRRARRRAEAHRRHRAARAHVLRRDRARRRQRRRTGSRAARPTPSPSPSHGHADLRRGGGARRGRAARRRRTTRSRPRSSSTSSASSSSRSAPKTSASDFECATRPEAFVDVDLDPGSVALGSHGVTTPL